MCRLCDHLDNSELLQRQVLHSPAFSAIRRAQYLEESPNRVLQSALLKTSAGLRLVLLGAGFDLDETALQEKAPGDLQLITAAHAHHYFEGCEFGVAPGFGKPFGLTVWMDQALLNEPYLIVPGWTTCLSYKLAPSEYTELEAPEVFAFGVKAKGILTVNPKSTRRRQVRGTAAANATTM